MIHSEGTKSLRNSRCHTKKAVQKQESDIYIYMGKNLEIQVFPPTVKFTFVGWSYEERKKLEPDLGELQQHKKFQL